MRCYKEAGDVAYALDVGEAALSRVRSWGLAGGELHAELGSSVLGAYYERGDLVRAQNMAREVLEALGPDGSIRGRAAVHWNASLVAEQRDDLPGALQLAERALAVYAEGDDARALARLRVAYGWLLLRCLPPKPAEARAELLASRAALVDVGTEVDLAYCETELARCELLLGDPARALELAETTLDRLGDAPRLEQAHTTLVRARALLALGRQAEAVATYRAAAAHARRARPLAPRGRRLAGTGGRVRPARPARGRRAGLRPGAHGRGCPGRPRRLVRRRAHRGPRGDCRPGGDLAAVDDLSAALAVAFERGDLRVAAQPIVSMTDGALHGVEVLLRWPGGPGPDVFVPLAEQSGLILPIGRWVLSRAVEVAADLLTTFGRAIPVSVNVSARQLQDATFVEHVAAELTRAGAARLLDRAGAHRDGRGGGRRPGRRGAAAGCAGWDAPSAWTTSAPAGRRCPSWRGCR